MSMQAIRGEWERSTAKAEVRELLEARTRVVRLL